MDLAEAAAYLHLTEDEVELLVRSSDIPHIKRGGRVMFLRGPLDEWASRRILGLTPKNLVDYHRKSTAASQEFLESDALIPALLTPQRIEPNLTSKTKKSTLRDMVAVADRTGAVLDSSALQASLEEREELCSTALPGGLALLHSRHHQEFLFDRSFLVLGRTLQPIHFGSPDGTPTRLFFMVCCHDERLHLHTLARLCLILQKQDVLDRLFSLPDPEAIHQELVSAEQAALAGKKSSSEVDRS